MLNGIICPRSCYKRLGGSVIRVIVLDPCGHPPFGSVLQFFKTLTWHFNEGMPNNYFMAVMSVGGVHCKENNPINHQLLYHWHRIERHKYIYNKWLKSLLKPGNLYHIVLYKLRLANEVNCFTTQRYIATCYTGETVLLWICILLRVLRYTIHYIHFRIAHDHFCYVNVTKY